MEGHIKDADCEQKYTVTLTFVMYGCATWSLMLRKEYRLKSSSTGC